MGETFSTGRARRAGAPVVRMRLPPEDADTLRFLFNDMERVAGVRSSHEDQIAALSSQHGALKEQDRVVAYLAGRALPLAERNRPILTARPGTMGVSARFPMRTRQLPGDSTDPTPVLVSWAPQDAWVCDTPAALRGRVRAAWLSVRSMAALPQLRAVLWCLYGPRDPSADYTTFGQEHAPIVHLTSHAAGLAKLATARARLEDVRAWAEGAKLDPAMVSVRSGITVGPREALAAELRRLRALAEGKAQPGAPAVDAEARAHFRGAYTELVVGCRLEADRLIVRATTAYLRAREAVS